MKETKKQDMKKQDVKEAVKNEVVVKPTSAVSTEVETDWGLESATSMDLIIPKLLIMQSPSKLVQQDKAQFGDLVNSVTGEILGTAREKDRKPVRFIPFMQQEVWINLEMVGTNPEFRGVEPRNPANNHWDREYTKDGKLFKRFKGLNYFVLLEKELETEEMPVPYLVSFRSTSFKAGQRLADHFFRCGAAARKGKPVAPPSVVFELCGYKTSNNKGTFYVMEVKDVGPSKPEHVEVARQWFKTLRTRSYKIDESDLEDLAGATEVDVTVNVKPGEVQDGAQF